MRGMRDARQHIAPAVGYGCACQGILPGLAVVRGHLIQRGRDSVGPLVHGLGVGEGDNGTTHRPRRSLDVLLVHSIGGGAASLGLVPTRRGGRYSAYCSSSTPGWLSAVVVSPVRGQLAGLAGDPQSSLEGVYDPSRMDPVTGLYTRASV